jgi:membrane AbrB-like protein
MIGPLFAVAAARLAGLPVTGPPGGRYIGQWIIGTVLGLYFTPVVVKQVVSFAPWMLMAGVYALISGLVCGMALARLANVDRRTAFFASVPGGATEMSILAERFGGRTDLVAVAQSLRIVMVVSLIPFMFAYLDVHGADRYVQGTRAFSWGGLALLMGLTALGGAALHRFRFPNGWVIGSLCVSLPLTAFQVDLSNVPAWLSNAGQLLIGCSLASRFKPDFLTRAPRFMAAVLATVMIGMGLAALTAWGLATAMPAHVATMVLAMAPGGVLACQMPRNFAAPSHSLLRDTMKEPQWRDRLSAFADWEPVAEPDAYYGWLKPHVERIDVWETEYLQVLSGDNAVLEWIKGSALVPVREALPAAEYAMFTDLYGARLRDAYPRRDDGSTLLPFRRLFIVARVAS